MHHNTRDDMRRGFRPTLVLLALGLALAASGCARKPAAPTAAEPVAAKPAEPASAKVAEPPPPVIEQAALDKLKAMSDTLAAAKSFTFRARSAVETPAKTGQFLTHFIESEVALQRPDKLRSNVGGDLPSYQFYYDGKTVAALDPVKNLYAVADAPKTIDETLPFIIERAGIDFPSAEVLYNNPYAEMTKGLTHAIVVGPSQVNGVACEHLAFIGAESNWEIWIDGKSLPRRLATTYKTLVNFPRFMVEFRDWQLNPKLSPAQFVFAKPPGAQPIKLDGKAEALPQ